jgi:NuA3 HAT complex component NTO1
MPGQAETPPMVTDVDSQGLFKMFDAGWILPTGQRRGGRQPVERVPLLPKKKKMDRGASRLSVFSTNASENQTLDDISGPSGLSVEEKVDMDVNPGVMPEASAAALDMDTQAGLGHGTNEEMETSMALDIPEEHQEGETERQLQPEPEPQPEVQPQAIIQPVVTELEEDREETQSELEARIAKIPIRPNTKINVENGKIVVEELDTPKLRREKARQRKAEKAAAAAAAAAAQRPPQAKAEIPKTNVGAVQDDVSDLSSLSELDSDTDEKPVTRGEATTSNTVKLVGTRQLQRAPAALITTGKALVVLEPGKQLECGTLVWAKADTYPWWPAVVWEPDDPKIPEEVRKKKPQDNSRHIVQFYDPTMSWTWVTIGNMLLLGEDNAVDASLLSPTSTVQKWKTPRIKKQCREAFQRALAEMETDADLLAREMEEVATEVTSSGSIKEQGPTDVDMAISAEQSTS